MNVPQERIMGIHVEVVEVTQLRLHESRAQIFVYLTPNVSPVLLSACDKF